MWSRLILVALLVPGMTLASCKARREAARPGPGPMDVAELVQHMKDAGSRFDWVSARFSLRYTGTDNKQLGLSGYMRIRNDSAIWISLSPLPGIEAARAVISTDSVRMVNRLNSTFFLGGLDYINQMLQTDLDYAILQALLCGNDIPYYEDDVFRSGISGNYHQLSTPGRRKLKKYVSNDDELERVLIQEIYLDPETFRIRKQEIKQVGHESRKLEIEYDDFREVGGQLFPHQVHCAITVDGSIIIAIDFNRIDTEGPLKMPFSIPSSYTRLN